MTFDVGVVTIDYSVRPPSGLVEEFARELKEYDEGDTWRVASDGHVFLDLEYETAVDLALEYISSRGLSSAEAHQILRWVRSLSWQDNHDIVTLHFGW